MNKFVVNCKNTDFDVYIGRGSRWGNPYSHMQGTQATWIVESREDAVRLYEEWLIDHPELIEAAQKELKNKILGCYCAPLDCHGEVLVKYANTKTLYRPVGNDEFKLIQDANFKKFPPRLPEQPIFYPVCNLIYAKNIATKWNKSGHIVDFNIADDFISKYETHIVGSSIHEEYWIPAEDLEEFNTNIIGSINDIYSVNFDE